MAKTIKFNLICDGKPVRTIEDLQENFSIEDVLNKPYVRELIGKDGFNKIIIMSKRHGKGTIEKCINYREQCL